jgi:hypothetical protein
MEASASLDVAKPGALTASDRPVDGSGVFGSLRGVLGYIPGDLTVAEPSVALFWLDYPEVELVAPSDCRHAVQEPTVRKLDSSPVAAVSDGLGRELGRCAGRHRCAWLRAVQPKDGVEVDRQPFLIFGDLGD